MKIITLLLLGGILAGCQTTDAPVRVTQDVSAVTNELEMVVGLAIPGAKPILPHAVTTKQAAGAELRRLYPGATFSECCEYRGWFIFSDTPAGAPLRFHGGYAVEKNGRRVTQFGFW